MALNKEIWEQSIQEQLFLNDEFMNTVGIDHSMYVNNKTVHIPQAGANPTIGKNISSFPMTVSGRTDTDLTYDMNIYYAPPIRIGTEETQWISYEKRASVLQASVNKLRNVAGNNTLYSWGGAIPSGSIVRTSGTATAKALAPSATGTRKDPKLEDFFNARAILGMQNLNPGDSIWGIVPENMYWALINDDNIKKALEWGAEPTAPGGKVAMIAGVKLLRRSAVTVWDSSAVIKTVGDEGTPTSATTSDNLGILVVSNSYVSKALGGIDVFTKEKDPEYFGDIISATVVHGSSKMRTNGEGLAAIVQTT